MNKTQTQFSPWGPVQTEHEAGPGLHIVTTASHGGMLLSLSRVAEMQRAMPGFSPFAGWPFLEEDCDMAAGIVVFREHFAAKTVSEAVRQCQADVGSRNALPIQRYLLTHPRGIALTAQVRRWQELGLPLTECVSKGVA
jgi:hypothetical protein